MRTLIAIVVGVGVLGYGAFYYIQHLAAEPPLELPHRRPSSAGDLLPTISATGTVEPEEVVDVGAQVAGLIKRLGDDPHDPGKVIDYGSHVEDGHRVWPTIDDSLYKAPGRAGRGGPAALRGGPAAK